MPRCVIRPSRRAIRRCFNANSNAPKAWDLADNEQIIVEKGVDGQYSIRINDQWRVCFRWENGDAHEVEIVDYH